MTTYRIPAEFMGTLTARFEKAAKRAAKLGVSAPSFEKVGCEEVDEMVPAFDFEVSGAYERTGRTRKVWEVAVSGVAPRFAGWEMVAVIDLDRDDASDVNVVNTLSGDTDPAWFTQPERCDHCHVDKRGRKKLVVVDHDNGDRKIVGTTCLRDFLGHDSPEQIASWVEFLAKLDGTLGGMSDDGEFEAGGQTEWRFDPVVFLSFVAQSMDDDGWVSRGAANEYQIATADRAYRNMGQALGFEKPDRYGVRPPMPSDAHRAEAEAAVEWAQGLEIGDNDYLNNLHAVSVKSGLRWKDLGIAAAGVMSWRRENEKLIERAVQEREGAASVHFGAVKERLVVTGTVTFTRELASDYGVSTLVKVLTDDGNVVVWWASSTAPEQGDRITGKATVKGHEVRDGVAQTVVNRWAWALDGEQVAA